MSILWLAWTLAAVGALFSCVLLTLECLGRRMPSWSPLREHMWGRFVLLFLVGVVWVIFSNV